MKLNFYFHKVEYADQVKVYLIADQPNGQRQIAKAMALEFVPLDECQMMDASLTFTGPIAREFFPALVQGLSESGYRYESSDAGELKATKTHLEDLRRIAFHKVGLN